MDRGETTGPEASSARAQIAANQVYWDREKGPQPDLLTFLQHRNLFLKTVKAEVLGIDQDGRQLFGKPTPEQESNVPQSDGASEDKPHLIVRAEPPKQAPKPPRPLLSPEQRQLLVLRFELVWNNSRMRRLDEMSWSLDVDRFSQESFVGEYASPICVNFAVGFFDLYAELCFEAPVELPRWEQYLRGIENEVRGIHPMIYRLESIVARDVGREELALRGVYVAPPNEEAERVAPMGSAERGMARNSAAQNAHRVLAAIQDAIDERILDWKEKAIGREIERVRGGQEQQRSKRAIGFAAPESEKK